MVKIPTKREILEKKAKQMMICTAPKKKHHCLNHCFHGVPHKKESGRDACHLTSEICQIQKPAIVRITCRHLNAKEQKAWVEQKLLKGK